MSINTRLTPVRPPLEGFYSRVMAYLCVAVTFLAISYEQGLTGLNLGIIVYALVYPHIVRFAADRLQPLQGLPSRLALLVLDGLHTGVFITLVWFSLVPTLVFLLLISFASLGAEISFRNEV